MGQFFSTLGQGIIQLRTQSLPIPFAGLVSQKIQPTCLDANFTYILVLTRMYFKEL